MNKEMENALSLALEKLFALSDEEFLSLPEPEGYEFVDEAFNFVAQGYGWGADEPSDYVSIPLMSLSQNYSFNVEDAGSDNGIVPDAELHKMPKLPSATANDAQGNIYVYKCDDQYLPGIVPGKDDESTIAA